MGRDQEKNAASDFERERSSEDTKTTPASDAESRSASDSLANTAAFSQRPHPGDAFSGKGRSENGDIPTTLGPFKINGILEKGGFGTVYLGFEQRLKRKVAIKVPNKVLSRADLDRFLEEAQRLAQLRHAGIVTVFDVGEFDGRCYIVSDYLEGVSLS